MLEHNPLRIPVRLANLFLAFMQLAPPHAPLVAYWRAERAAALSIPTWEYFQSPGEQVPPTPHAATSLFSSPISPSYNATPSTARYHHHQPPSPTKGVRGASERLRGSGPQQHSQELCVLRDADAASVRLVWAPRMRARRAAPSRTEPHANGLGEDSDGTGITAGSSNDGSRVTRRVVGRGWGSHLGNRGGNGNGNRRTKRRRNGRKMSGRRTWSLRV